MSSGKKRNPSSTPVRPVMIYLPADEVDRVRKYSDDQSLSVSRLAREGLHMRLDRDGDRYIQGYNDAIHDVIKIVRETKGAQMMFPSGKSFAQLVCDGVEPLKRVTQNGRE